MKKALLALSILFVSYSAHAAKCADFATQAQAQSYMHQYIY
ncbi:hypothetical protein X781_4680 [Mannheimia sp. USDA-ARS-USMARC-1261]|nr:hypothetical protein X781_4680 [Mannheimia sp. USDA-ARS-USMARC-1261]